MAHQRKKEHPPEPSALDVARGDLPHEQLPRVQDDPRNEPGTAGEPHHGQAGHAGSGKDARLESVGQSESDRAAGKSR